MTHHQGVCARLTTLALAYVRACVVCRVSCVVCRVSCVVCRVSCVVCRVSCVGQPRRCSRNAECRWWTSISTATPSGAGRWWSALTSGPCPRYSSTPYTPPPPPEVPRQRNGRQTSPPAWDAQMCVCVCARARVELMVHHTRLVWCDDGADAGGGGCRYMWAAMIACKNSPPRGSSTPSLTSWLGFVFPLLSLPLVRYIYYRHHTLPSLR
jgi:hypothetical protein